MPSGPLHSSLRRYSAAQSVVEEQGRLVAGASDLVSPIVARGYDIWRMESGDARMPLAGMLAAEKLVSILPYVYLVDVLEDAGERDFRYRLIGTDIVSHTEADNTGRLLSDIAGQGSQATLIRLYDLATTEEAAAVQRIAYRSRLGYRLWYETIVMPMAVEPGGPVRRLLGVAEHFSQAV